MAATTAAMIEQFNKDNILILEEMGYEVHVLGNFYKGNPISEERLENFKIWIKEHHGKWFHYPAARKPTDLKNNIKAYKYLLKLISKYQYEFIHCHTPIGSVIARLAAHKMHTKVIYTAHGFHFFKGAPLKNWLLYYPVERLLSRWTDVLILINQEDYQRSEKEFHAKQTEYIPGVGIDYGKFAFCQVDLYKKKQEIGIKKDDFVIISVGEINDNKNHQIIIKAIAKLKDKSIKYIICGKGEREEKLKKIIKKFRLDNQILLLGYREDIPELLSISELFAFPSKREGLGLAAIEAMASGQTLITSNVHGINDYSENDVTGYKYAPDDYRGFAEGIKMIMTNNEKRKMWAENNRLIAKKYDVKEIRHEMKRIYQEIKKQ